ncbi:hypothetical protein O4H26_09265 [Aequorivita viscosa]|nr:hypothetical protein [Aequorivita viscosa]
MKYILAIFFFYSIGVQASNYTSFQNDNTNVSKTNHKGTPIESDLDSELNTIGDFDQERKSINNLDLFLELAAYLFVFIFGFICAIIFYNLRLRSLLHEEFESYKNEYKNGNGKFSFLLIGVIKILKEHKNEYKYHSLSKENNILSKSSLIIKKNLTPNINNPASSNSQTDESLLNEEKSPSYNWDRPSQQENNTNELEGNRLNILFFSAPEQDGSFSIDNSSITAMSRSYYKLEYSEDDVLGKLIYRSGDLDSSALSQMDFILGPVCDIENSSMVNPSIIHIESDGSVLKDGNSWRIQKKIKLKLS